MLEYKIFRSKKFYKFVCKYAFFDKMYIFCFYSNDAIENKESYFSAKRFEIQKIV